MRPALLLLAMVSLVQSELNSPWVLHGHPFRRVATSNSKNKHTTGEGHCSADRLNTLQLCKWRDNSLPLIFSVDSHDTSQSCKWRDHFNVPAQKRGFLITLNIINGRAVGQHCWHAHRAQCLTEVTRTTDTNTDTNMISKCKDLQSYVSNPQMRRFLVTSAINRGERFSMVWEVVFKPLR